MTSVDDAESQKRHNRTAPDSVYQCPKR